MFGRVVRLYVGKFDAGNRDDGTSYDLSALDVEFECFRSVEWYDNSATVTVYNPSPSTLSVLMTEANSLVLQAGYEDGAVGNVFAGQISHCEASRKGTDVVAVVTCIQSRGNFYQLARLNCSVAFDKGKTVRECLSELCAYAGVALRGESVAGLSKRLEDGYNCTGTFTGVLRDFSATVLKPLCGLKVYLDNNEMLVFGEGNTLALEEVELGWDSGLLECREVRDESKNAVNFADDPAYFYFSGSDMECPEPKARPSVEIKRDKEISFRCLMNPAIVPNCFVNVDSRRGDAYDSALAVNGRFIVTDCTYRGGNVGSDFTVECTASERPFDGGRG